MQIVEILLGADAGIAALSLVALAAKIHGGSDLAFNRLGRLARHQIDFAAHAARAVKHGGIALGNLDFRKVGGEETSKIEAIVGGQIDAHAIKQDRDLPAVKAMDENILLVARAGEIVGDDAGGKLNGLVERCFLEGFELFCRDRVAADRRRARGLEGQPG